MIGSQKIGLVPNSSSSGTDFYLINSEKDGGNHSLVSQDLNRLIDFEITLPNGNRITQSDLGINLTYGSKEVFNYKSQGWFSIDNQDPVAGNVKFESDFSDNGRKLTDKKTNDTAFTLGIEGQEDFSKS